MTFRRVFLLPAILLAVLLAAAATRPRRHCLAWTIRRRSSRRRCGPPPSSSSCTRASRPTQEVGGESQRYTLEGDLNLAQREFHAAVDLAGGMGMQQRAEILLVGTDIFTRTQDPTAGGTADDRWQRIPIDAGSDPRNGIPATPAIAVALRALLSDPGLTAKLEGMETCGDRQCYHVTLTIAPDLTWRAINGALVGAPPGGELGPVDPAVPEITLDVLVDEATRRLMSAEHIDRGRGPVGRPDRDVERPRRRVRPRPAATRAGRRGERRWRHWRHPGPDGSRRHPRRGRQRARAGADGALADPDACNRARVSSGGARGDC